MNEKMTILAEASAFDVAARIRNGDISAVQVTEACLARIEAFDAKYRVYITVLREQALQAAKDADAKVRAQKKLGLLHGVPVNVKDAFLLHGSATTLGSKLLRDYPPKTELEATCVQRLRHAGAIILGKVNLGSGMRSDPAGTSIDPPRNPWRLDHTPGGSSSGSAVSVALGMGYASVGTDLGGSIRNPAALTGVVGLKPTFGLVSQNGDIFGLCRRLEHVGPLTRTVRDAALVLTALVDHQAIDSTRETQQIPDYLSGIESALEHDGLRVGWVSDGGPAGAEADILASVEKSVGALSDLGIEVKEISLPSFAQELWYQITFLDEWEAYDKEYQIETEPYAAYIRGRLQKNRKRAFAEVESREARLQTVYKQLFADFDLLILPTSPITAKPFTSKTIAWKEKNWDTFDLQNANLWMFNITGNPAISIPCGFSRDYLPIGIQLVGRQFEERRLLKTAAQLERIVGGFQMPRP
jgi:Asp-tRNA(Asn)/Glu-tRNA(Gln) amidotransferase A subunit family amidase